MHCHNTSDIGTIVYNLCDTLAQKIAGQWQATLKDILQQYDVSEEKLLEYARYEIACLANAIMEQNPVLFSDHIAWLKTLFHNNNIPLKTLEIHFDILKDTVLSTLPPETHNVIMAYLYSAHEIIVCEPHRVVSHIDLTTRYGGIASRYLAAVLSGDRAAAVAIIMDAFATGTSIEDIYLRILEPAQKELGRLWQEGHITVGQEHFASAVTQLCISHLYYPHIAQAVKTKGAIIVCCAPGELHEIGARMFADLCELRGWHVYFLGANVSLHRFVDYLAEKQPHFVGISATMSTSVAKTESIIKKIKSAPISPIKIIVGGYGFSQSPGLWHRVGADYYAADIQSACVWMESFVKNDMPGGGNEKIP